MAGSDSVAERRRLVALAGHRADIERIRAHADDEDRTVRESALRALDRASALTTDELARALEDPAPEVRAAAAELSAPRPSPSLVAALADEDDRVVEVASWASGERNPPEPGVVSLLVEIARTHRDPLCRESAIAALGALGDEAGRDAVLAGLDDRPAVRRRAVIALAAFDGPDVDAALERARSDSDRQVRDAVEDLLGPA